MFSQGHVEVYCQRDAGKDQTVVEEKVTRKQWPSVGGIFIILVIVLSSADLSSDNISISYVVILESLFLLLSRLV
jgi:UDP-N-acetylmuramyl pentapeptide phosphotransferase/UDP-N-acetylglucosamine-1-phosphate transferase